MIYKTLPDVFPESGAAVSLGFFDGLHRGHLAVLNAMKAKADGLSTAVFTFSTDTLRPASKTNQRLMSDEARDKLLKNFGVDYIIEPEFESIRDMSPEQFAKSFLADKLHAKKVFCGEDFRFGKKAAAGAEDLRVLLAGTAEVIIVPTLAENNESISTTRIRSLILEGDIAKANELLGRPFAIDFAVEHGRKLGRTLGLPTINQAFPENFTVPKFGVYASFTEVGGIKHASITNVGVKPTVGSSHVLAETYINDFSGDLYGKRVTVGLVKFIRGEIKFADVKELKAQIDKDSELACEMLNG